MLDKWIFRQPLTDGELMAKDRRIQNLIKLKKDAESAIKKIEELNESR